MAKKKEPTLAEEANLPESWHPVDAEPIVPSQAANPGTGAPANPNTRAPFFVGPISPNLQHDATFVSTKFGSSGIPSLPLMPAAPAGTPTVNSAIKSGGVTILPPASTPVTSATDANDFIWMGNWVSTTFYNPNDLVQFNTSTYLCLVGNSGVEPDSNTTDWVLVSENLHFDGFFSPGFNANSSGINFVAFPPGLGTGTKTVASASLTTLNPNDFVVLFAHSSAANGLTLPTGFTSRDSIISGGNADAVGDLSVLVPATATYTTTFTTTGNNDADVIGCTLTALSGTIAFKQAVRCATNGSTGITVSANDLVIVYARFVGTTPGNISVSDTAGNPYTLLTFQAYATGGPETVDTAIFAGRMSTSGTITINIVGPGHNGFLGWLVEYSGTPAPHFPFDTVEYRGSTYVCVHKSSSDPVTDSGNWVQLAQGSGFVNSQTASYLAIAGDYGKLIVMNGSGLTLTLPSTPPQQGWWIDVENINLTSLTISPNGLTIDGSSSNLTVFQNQGVVIFTDGVNYFTMRGGLSSAPISVYSQTTPTTPLGATNLLASAPPGLYRVSFYSVVTTTGVGGTSFSLNFIYTDVKQAQTIAAFTNSTFTAGNVNEGNFIIQNQGTANIQYSLTEVGTFSTHPVLGLYMTLERLH